jgi:hypothetical protein
VSRRIAGATVAAVVEALFGRFVLAPVVTGPFTLVLGAAASGLCFLAVVALVDREALSDAVALLRRGKRVAPAP